LIKEEVKEAKDEFDHDIKSKADNYSPRMENEITGNITIRIQNIEGTGGLSGTIAGPLSQTTDNLTSPTTNTGDRKNQTQSSESVNFVTRIMGNSP
jgi:hypothetical protein